MLATSLIYAQSEGHLIDESEKYASSLSIDMDVGYTSYIIDVTSSELNRAIDYDVLELRLGSSYSYGNWMWGVNTKVLLREEQSNLQSKEASTIIKDSATIDRQELSLYGSYKLNEEFRANLLYRYANLKSTDGYHDVVRYDTSFDYRTDGVALSLVYIPSFLRNEKQLLWLSSGVVYSQAQVEIDEKVDERVGDVSIDDSSNAVGFQLGMGYNYSVRQNLMLKLSADWYRFDFGELDVMSRNLNRVLEKASLEEETYSVRLGVVYRF